MSAPQYKPMRESEVCNAIGWVLIALGFIAGFLFILAFGRIEVASYYGKETVWSTSRMKLQWIYMILIEERRLSFL